MFNIIPLIENITKNISFHHKLYSVPISGEYWEELLFKSLIESGSQPVDMKIMLDSIVGEYDGIWVYPRGFNKGGLQGYKGKSPTITTSSWQHNFFISKDGINRKFTINEVEAIQTLPKDYTIGPSINQRYKLCGNSWTLSVINHILCPIIQNSSSSDNN